MKKYAIFIIISLLFFTNANAKWKYKPGDIVEGEVVFSKKDSFKLPPGEFFVALNSKEKEGIKNFQKELKKAQKIINDVKKIVN